MTVGLITLIEDLGITPEAWQGIDNQAALSVLQDTSSWRTRHLAIRSAVLRDLVKEGVLKCSHVASKDQLADGLTKFLKPEGHKQTLLGWCLKGPLEYTMDEMDNDSKKNDILSNKT